ncbi:MAG: hypothetical protein JO314_09445 [Acidobacteria bacterium]|nr:hypothetical protein [Acidobacteriota bacterium]
MTEQPQRRWPFVLADAFAGLLLFAGTAAVVWWQNTRLTVLYDLAGVLEPASRMAQGDVPYRDFPFPYAPLTFWMQSEVIKLTAPIYWHHIVYCCIVAGLASVLAWRVIYLVITGSLPRPRLTAFLLALPTVVLGVYCVFPHPFYDPDACFVVLLCLWLLLVVERWQFPSVLTVLLGMLFVLPLFVKQNIGLAFGAAIALWLLVRIILGLWKKWPVVPYLQMVAGALAGLGIAALVIRYACGIENYKYWTWDFATSRRAPSAEAMLGVYADWWLAAWVAMFLLGAGLFRRFSQGKRWEAAIATLAMAVPFVWPVIYLAMDADESERAERLIGLWPFVMIVLVVLAYAFCRRVNGVSAALPFILIATAHGVFLSQQLWGSTYAIWPLLMIMVALLLRQLHDPEGQRSRIAITVLAVVISASVCAAGASYVYSEERLEYVSWNDGDMQHSTLPQLQGMSMRGDFLPQFDELVTWTDANIPRDQGILLLPGEDLFFYTTQRHPHFPIELFDVTNNPYDVAEIHRRVADSDIEWLIVKDDLEIEADDMIDSKSKIFEELKPDFRHIDDLDNYAIWKRRHPGDPPDDEDDDDSDPGDDDPGD